MAPTAAHEKLSPCRLWVRGLNLLSAPASILSLAHVAGGLDGGNELEGDVCDTDDADDGTSDFAENAVAEEKAAEEDVKSTATDKRKQEQGVTRDLGRDLELEKTDSGAKKDHVDTNNHQLELQAEDVHDTSQDGDDADNQVDDSEDIRKLHYCGREIFKVE